jgi:hypothetical protein
MRPPGGLTIHRISLGLSGLPRLESCLKAGAACRSKASDQSPPREGGLGEGRPGSHAETGKPVPRRIEPARRRALSGRPELPQATPAFKPVHSSHFARPFWATPA